MKFVRLPLRGQRRLARTVWHFDKLSADGSGPLLPVELRHANHTASTNAVHFRLKSVTKPYNCPRMPSASQIDQIAERVERLLVRYEELQRTNALLAEQVDVLTHERDSLKSRLSAARARVDALLERLPEIKSAA
jgi:cell division protein ZapB